MEESSSDDEDLLQVGPKKTVVEKPLPPRSSIGSINRSHLCLDTDTSEQDLIWKEEKKVRTIVPLIDNFIDTQALTSLSDDYGLPTCVTSSSTIPSQVMFGTLRGGCIVVDVVRGTPITSLPSTDESAGACTCLCISADGRSILVGHKSGQIVLWSLGQDGQTKPLLTRTIFNATVSCAQFVRRNDAQFCLVGSNQGHLLLLSFSSHFMSIKCDIQILLEPSPKVGAVLRIAPLIDPNGPVAAHCLCAVTCSQAVILLALNPHVQLLHKMRFGTNSDGSTVPDAVWGNGEPLLYVVSSKTVHVMKTENKEVDGAGKWDIVCIQKLNWPLNIHTLSSLSSTFFCIFDHSNKLTMVERPPSGDTWNIVDAVDAGPWSLAYQSHGSNLRSYHGSIVVQSGLKSKPLFFCSLNYFAYRISLIKWVKVMEKMANENKWSDALDVFLGIHSGVYPPLLDFPPNPIEKRSTVCTRASQMILLFVDKALAEPENLAKFTAQIVDACIQLKVWNLLYKTLFERYTQAKQFSIFRIHLEPFLMSGGEVADEVTGEVYMEILQAYAPLLENEHKTAISSIDAADVDSGVIDCDVKPDKFPIARRVQRLVLSLGLHKLDLNMSIRMLTRHRLWSALIFVYANALRDLCSVVDILVAECTRIVKIMVERGTLNSLEVPLVRKLFIFLKRTFNLKPFPVDQEKHAAMVPPEPAIVAELVRHLFKPKGANAAFILCKLLGLSAQATMECFGELFQEGRAPVLPAHEFLNFLENMWNEAPADIKASAAAELNTIEGSSIDEHLLILRAKASIWLEKSFIEKDKMLQLASSLLDVKLKCCEQLCLRVLRTLVDIEPIPQVEHKQLLHRAIGAQKFQLASFLHEVNGNYDHAIQLRIQAWPKGNVFEYLQEMKPEILSVPETSETILSKISKLIELDFDKTIGLLKSNFTEIVGVDRVAKSLDQAPKLQKEFLEYLFADNSILDSTAQKQFHNNYVIKYVSLLCNQAPASVLPYLLENETLPLDECLKLCEEHNITDAAAHLLEKTGNFPKVFILLIQDLQDDLQLLKDIFEKSPQDIRAILLTEQAEKRSIGIWWSPTSEVGRCIDRVHYAHELCSRNVNIMTEDHLQTLWFGFLRLPLHALTQFDRRIGPPLQEDFARAYQRSLKCILSHIMKLGLLAFLSPPMTMHHLLDTQSERALRDLKDPFGDIFRELQFHRGLLLYAKSIAAMDVVNTFNGVYESGKNNVAVVEARCDACELPFCSSTVSCFGCGHGFHRECLEGRTVCIKCTPYTWSPQDS